MESRLPAVWGRGWLEGLSKKEKREKSEKTREHGYSVVIVGVGIYKGTKEN